MPHQQAELLVSGFIRHIFNIAQFSQVIPVDILSLCHSFYATTSQYLLLISGSYYHSRDPQIHNAFILNVSNMQKHTLHIAALNASSLTNAKSTIFCNGTLFGSSSCVIPNTTIPNWLYPSLQQSTGRVPATASQPIYTMIVTSGGYDYMRPKCKYVHSISSCSLHIFNSTHLSPNKSKITAYQHSLPSLPVSMTGHSSIYSAKTGCVYTIGGAHIFPEKWYETSTTLSSLYALNLYKSPLEWKEYKLSSPARGRTGCCLGGQDDILFIAGGTGAASSVSMLKIDVKAKLDADRLLRQTMNYARYSPGCVFSTHKNWLCVAGGSSKDGADAVISKSVEWLDLKKLKKWNVLRGYTKYLHCCQPSVWFEPYNPNILYVAGNQITDSTHQQLGKIEYTDIRERVTKWQALSTKSLTKLFKINGRTYTTQQLQHWRSQSLLPFMAM